jgi:outer membrane receptor protein involved in Fe transport
MLRRRAISAPLVILAAVLAGSSLPARAQAPARPTPTSSAQVVVSADKVPEDVLDVAGAAEVVKGEDLRRRGARTLQDALQDVVGVEAAGGSDNGPRFPNLGVWGLKEFDALLVTVDGLPVGGPFNPSLAQIPIEEIERIEIVKGPQGTLYGVSAFAGAVNVFTRRGKRTEATLGLGSWNDRHVSVSYEGHQSDNFLRVAGSMFRDHGFQDLTDSSVDRLSVSYGAKSRGSSWDVTAGILRDTAYWGSPLPVEEGALVPGFEVDRNYAVRGARMDHRVYTLASNLSQTLSPGVVLENTFGLTRDEQIAVRSFIDGVEGSTATANGTSLRPVESTAFDDLRVVATQGAHRLVLGAALTWGRTTSSGTGFDLTLTTGPNPVVPSVDDLPVGDHRSAEDRRTFLGFYINDTWTPWTWFSMTLGARYDRTSESLTADAQEVGAPEAEHAEDERTDGKWSGGVSALFRVVDKPDAGFLNAVHLYVAAKSNFKPAAPNILEAEAAQILEPERSRSGEIGLRSRLFGGSVALDASFFHMSLENVVVSTLGPDGLPMLTNAGEERFQGFETQVTWTPHTIPALSLSAGYAHHDATYVRFSFADPDGNLVVVDGNRLELVPRDTWNLRAAWAPKTGLGAWAAVRHAGVRPLDPENTVSVPSYYEWDAGVSWENEWLRFALVGRNLGDNRRYVTESELGDSQFFVAPPRRVVGEVTVRF